MPDRIPDDSTLAALLSPVLEDLYFTAFHEVTAHAGAPAKQAAVDLAGALHGKFSNAVLFLDECEFSLLDDEVTLIRLQMLERIGGPEAFLRALNAELQFPDRYLYTSVLTLNFDDLTAPFLPFIESRVPPGDLERLKEKYASLDPLPATGALLIVEEGIKLMNRLAAITRKCSHGLTESIAIADQWAFIQSATYALHLPEAKSQAEYDLSGESRRLAGKTLAQVLRLFDNMAKRLIAADPKRYEIPSDVPGLPNAGKVRMDLLVKTILMDLPAELGPVSKSFEVDTKYGPVIFDFTAVPPKFKPIKYGAVLDYLQRLYGIDPTLETIRNFVFDKPLSRLRKRASSTPL